MPYRDEAAKNELTWYPNAIRGERLSTPYSRDLCCKYETLTSVVCVLHDSHHLDTVVPELLDPGQQILLKFLVRPDLGLRGGDPDVRFVDLQPSFRGDLHGQRSCVFERVPLLLGRVPEPRIVDGGDVQVLGYSLDPGGKTVDRGAVGFSERDLRVPIEGFSAMSGGRKERRRRTLIMES